MVREFMLPLLRRFYWAVNTATLTAALMGEESSREPVGGGAVAHTQKGRRCAQRAPRARGGKWRWSSPALLHPRGSQRKDCGAGRWAHRLRASAPCVLAAPAVVLPGPPGSALGAPGLTAPCSLNLSDTVAWIFACQRSQPCPCAHPFLWEFRLQLQGPK